MNIFSPSREIRITEILLQIIAHAYQSIIYAHCFS